MKKTFLSTLMFCAALAASAQYTIYPVPQKMQQGSGTASFTNTVTIVCDEGIDQATKNRAEQVLTEHGLTVVFADKAPATGSVLTLTVSAGLAQDGRFDAHNLILLKSGNDAQVNITGQHSDAVFMGLASLEQMLDARGITNLPCVTINDYADQQQRGLVEGYYGYPYSIDVKQDLMRFMMRHKMNSYMYGAKSEPYHHSKWREAYPTSVTDAEKKRGYLTQDMVREICETSAETKVNFIWSIHPGNDFLGNANSVTDIMNKYQMMYDLGVRQFGLFVDDVSIPTSAEDLALNAQRVTQLQERINERWNTADAAPEARVKPLNFVPQVYCYDFAGGSEKYANFFNALRNTPEEVIVYTTGHGVWSVPNAGDFNQPKQYLGRDVAWWWNYPCNDNADSRIYPLDMYSNFVNMPAVGNGNRLDADLNVGIGIVANPMQQGEVAKIPLFSVADYAWNASGFNNQASWEASFPAILNSSEKAGALKALAPYLAYNDPQGSLPAATPEATKTNIDGVLADLTTVKGFAQSTVDSDKLLWDDLSPWALKLEQMLESGKKFIDAANTDTDRDTRWAAYTDGAQRYEDFNSNDAYISYTLEGMNATVGTPHLAQPSEQYFRPYLTSLHRSAVKDLIPARSRYAAAYTNTDAQIRAVNSAQQVYATMGETELKPNDYVGIALPAPTRLAQIAVAADLSSRFAVSTSADGRSWTPLQSGATTVDGYVKYVKIANAGSAAQSLALSASNFSLTTYGQPSLVDFTAPTDKDYNSRNNVTDGNVDSWWAANQNQATGDVIRLNYSAAAPVKQVRFVIHNTNGDNMAKGRIEVGSTADGTFTPLKKKGANVTSFSLADMTPLHADGTPFAAGEDKSKAYIYEIVMDGAGLVGQYVRFYNEQANTNKWIRVAEFTTEFDTEASPCADFPAVCDGQASTSVLVPAGTTVTYNPNTAYDVEGVDVFTDRGILPATASADGTITLNYSEPTRIYEIVARTQEPVGGIFSSTAESAQYYGLKFQAANCYISENSNADNFVKTTTDLSTTWAFVGSDNGFKMLSSTGNYLGVKNSGGTDYCYTLTGENQAAEFVIVGDNGTTFEIARSGQTSSTFNPWGGNGAGKNIGFWNAGAENNKLVLVDVAQPEPPVEQPAAVFPICVPTDQAYTNAHGRKLKSVSVTTATGGTQRIVCDDTRVYNDLTAQRIYAKSGEEITVNFDYNGKDWMNGYVYLDRNRNGELTPELNQTNAVPTENSELLAFSFYCLNRTSDQNGFNSTGAAVSGGARAVVNPPKFRLPDNLPDGDYTLRFKIDWNNIDPAGDVAASFLTNGGAFADVTLRVGDGKAPVPGRLQFASNVGFFVSAGSETGLPATAPTSDLALRIVRPADCYAFPQTVDVVVTNAEGTEVKLTPCSVSADGRVTVPAAAMEGGDVTISAELTAPKRYARTDYQVALREEFNGENRTEPNADVWKRADHNNNSAWNRFVSTSDKVVYLEDGDLVTRCIPCAEEDRESNKNPISPYDYRDWMSGAVDTRGLYSFRYGRIDVRALTNPFTGSFPAIWMIPDDQSAGWPQYGEIDIWEMVNTGSTAHGTVHAARESQKTGNTPCNYDGLYHVYSLEWTPDRFVWSVDGKEPYSTYNKATDVTQANLNGGYWPFDKPYYIILNQSVGAGGWAANPVDGHEYETRFDFVHVYQTYEQNNALETALDTKDQTNGVYYIRLEPAEGETTPLYLSTKEVKDVNNYTYTLSTEPEGFYVSAAEGGGFTITSTSGKRVGFGNTQTIANTNSWDCFDVASVWTIANPEEAFNGAATTIFKNDIAGLGVNSRTAGAGVFTDKPKQGETLQKWQLLDVTPATIVNLSETVNALPNAPETNLPLIDRIKRRILKK